MANNEPFLSLPTLMKPWPGMFCLLTSPHFILDDTQKHFSQHTHTCPRGLRSLWQASSLIYRPVYSLQLTNACLSCTLKLKPGFLCKCYAALAINGPAETTVKSRSRFQYLRCPASLCTVTKLEFRCQIGNYVEHRMTFMFTFFNFCLLFILRAFLSHSAVLGLSHRELNQGCWVEGVKWETLLTSVVHLKYAEVHKLYVLN